MWTVILSSVWIISSHLESESTPILFVPKTKIYVRYPRDCRNNAIYAHSLKHWRYQLNAQVLEYVADQGCLDADAIVSRESWSDEACATLADTLVEAMRADQSIDQMWLVFKDTIEQAENSNMVSDRQYQVHLV